MKRAPRPSLHHSLFPALVTAVAAAACDNSQPTHQRPRGVHRPDAQNVVSVPVPTPIPIPPPPSSPPSTLPSELIDPAHLPATAQGGLRLVTPIPAPRAQTPRTQGAAPPSFPGMLALAGRPAGLYTVHEHPAAEPCQSIPQSAMRNALPR